MECEQFRSFMIQVTHIINMHKDVVQHHTDLGSKSARFVQTLVKMALKIKRQEFESKAQAMATSNQAQMLDRMAKTLINGGGAALYFMDELQIILSEVEKSISDLETLHPLSRDAAQSDIQGWFCDVLKQWPYESYPELLGNEVKKVTLSGGNDCPVPSQNPAGKMAV